MILNYIITEWFYIPVFFLQNVCKNVLRVLRVERALYIHSITSPNL